MNLGLTFLVAALSSGDGWGKAPQGTALWHIIKHCGRL